MSNNNTHTHLVLSCLTLYSARIFWGGSGRGEVLEYPFSPGSSSSSSRASFSANSLPLSRETLSRSTFGPSPCRAPFAHSSGHSGPVSLGPHLIHAQSPTDLIRLGRERGRGNTPEPLPLADCTRGCSPNPDLEVPGLVG